MSAFPTSLYVRRLPEGRSPYQVDAQMFARFDQRNNMTVGRPNWDESIQCFNRRMAGTRIRRIRSGDPGFGIHDYGLFLAAGTAAYQHGTRVNHANRGLSSWAPAQDWPIAEMGQWEGSPVEATRMVKRAARFMGADLVGIASLNRQWFFSHAFWADGTHKEVVFADTEEPAETERHLVIPESMRWVIVMAQRMDYRTIRYSPSPIGCAETMATYSRMALLVSGMAEFIRGMGYLAIPSMNDLALSIPMAIDAGLGEQGRNGKLITPRFGPSVRLSKVITDLPLYADQPIRFGVSDFCRVCLKCAIECPPNCIPTGEPTWSGPGISNASGVYTWHLDNEGCRRYWATMLGDNCTICIRACPFSKAQGLVHDLVRATIANVPQLNPLLVRMDDILGYGKGRAATSFWRGNGDRQSGHVEISAR